MADFRCPRCDNYGDVTVTTDWPPKPGGRINPAYGIPLLRTACPDCAKCELCNGSGMVSYGNWGNRPPRRTCTECNGAGRIATGSEAS